MRARAAGAGRPPIPTRWQNLYREALGLSRLVHAGGAGDARSAAIPPNPAREFPLTIEPRLLLFDAQRKLVAGREEYVDRAMLKPIENGDATVGYVGYVPRPQFIESIQRVFFAQQHGKFAAAAVGMLLAGFVLAALLSYWLTRRVRMVARGAASLMQGDYGVRVPVRGHDELAQLASDFNRLAETLAATRAARQQWIADIAHELRTPLAVLRGEIEALQDGVRPLGPEGLASLAQETGRLARLVEDLHALSRADLGALTYHKERFDLAELVQEFLQGQRRTLQERGIALAVSAAEPMPVVGDEARLAQVFGNLLQNTLRYTDAPGRLDVTLLRVNGDIEIEWADSAPGVSAEDLPRLTDRLYRVDGSRSRAGGGSGLGLAIAKAIVDAHHGSMVASASPLGGLRWRICAAGGQRTQTMAERVLIVEDEPKLAELLRDYLAQDGYETAMLDRGDEVEPWVREHGADLVLLDLMLPGKSGLDVCRELRASTDAAVIMVTARVEEIDRLLGLELGADDYVCKPFSPREVVARVKAVLRRTRRHEGAGEVALVLDEEGHRATVQGRDLGLTAVEFGLLKVLASRPGRIWSRDQLMDVMYRDERVVVRPHDRQPREEAAPQDCRCAAGP